MRIVLVLGCWLGQVLFSASAAPNLPWKVMATYPHDSTSFTQGLVIDGDRLIEGTGLYGQSRLTVRSRVSGALLLSASLPHDQFGEGVAVAGDRIIQLTWMNGIAHVFDRSLHPLTRFRLSTEGWGLTFDGRRLIRSDGSACLRFLDPNSFVETGQVDVADGAVPVVNLNELEFSEGYVYANVWQSDRIAVIEPASGQVKAWIDLKGLSERFPKPANWDARDAVLNGIAVLPESGHLLVTGKLWPLMFEISIDRSMIATHGRKPSHDVAPQLSRER